MESKHEYSKHWKTLQNTGFWGEQGAGCLVLAQSTGRFLVALRSEHCLQPRTYGTIGGAIDAGESPIIDIKPLYVFSRETGAGTVFNYHNFVVLIEHEFEAHEHWETEKFLWVSYEELSLLHPKHYGLEELLLKSGEILSEYETNCKRS